MKRIAAIDFGTVRIGIAVSDERQILASPLSTIVAKPTLKETAALVAHTLSAYSLDKVVIGLPLFLDGKESPMSQKAREFGTHLESLLAIPIIYWDERLSSSQVDRTLKEGGLNRKKRAALSDKLAAAAILQNYLDYLKTKI